MKYFIFSIDDGTVYDKKVIEIFNKYNIKATFNLNSGLNNYVWYLNDLPIHRINLNEHKDLYKGHEVASHSFSHPHLTMCPGEIIVKEVGEDINNLEKIFNKEITTFAFPFEDFDERCIDIIKHLHNIKIIRLSSIDKSFSLPTDLYHVHITSLDINEANELIKDFISNDDNKLFVFVSHSYDFEVNQTYDKLEELCSFLNKRKDIEVITMSQLINLYK